MPEEQPSNIYREQLSSLSYGTALWKPNPIDGVYDQVSIGDVGYISGGAFIRMFNVTLSWDDASNRALGEPCHYDTLLPLNDFVVNRERFGQIDYSRGVDKEENSSNMQAISPDQAEGVTYKCRGRGAILSLPRGGLRQEVIHKKLFEDYIRKNVGRWFNWTKERRLPVEYMEDLVLVYGCTLVTSWAAAAFNGNARDAQLSLANRTLNHGGASFVWRNIRGTVDYHDSQLEPNSNNSHAPQNRCVFIKCLRAKRVLFWTRHLRGAAEPLPDDPDNSQEDEIQVTQVADVSKYRDPLIGVLDYIVEKRLGDTTYKGDIDRDDMAITHHGDLQLINNVDLLNGDTVERFLRENDVPLLSVNGATMLRHHLWQVDKQEESDKSPGTSYRASTTVNRGSDTTIGPPTSTHQPAPFERLPSAFTATSSTMPSVDRYRRDRSVLPSAPISAAVDNEGNYSASKGSTGYSADSAASFRFSADDGGSDAVSIIDSGYDSSSIQGSIGSSASSGRARGFAFSPDPAPPPGADPRLWSGFLRVDVDHSGYISAPELQAALVNGDSTPFDTETVKLLINLFDTKRTGEIDFNEFTELSGYIDKWAQLFERFDKDHSGTLDISELQAVLTQIGSQLPPQLMRLLVAKFASSPSGSRVGEQTITFDRFIRACVFVTKFKESFADHDTDKDGVVHLNYQQCMKFFLMLP